jgi:hypothetical protein
MNILIGNNNPRMTIITAPAAAHLNNQQDSGRYEKDAVSLLPLKQGFKHKSMHAMHRRKNERRRVLFDEHIRFTIFLTIRMPETLNDRSQLLFLTTK